MRSLLRAASAAAALALVLAVPASASGAPSVYHGAWDTEDFCGEVSGLSGNWNVTLQPDGTAVVHVAIFIEGEPHAFWGGNAFHIAWVQQTPAADEVFSLLLSDLPTPYGPFDLTFVLDDAGRLTYGFSDMCGPGAPATLSGHLTR